MNENSSAGLVLLPGEVLVTVTREEHHQAALARYPVAPGAHRQVAVELGWCVIGAGEHRGEAAIEVRLDGHRVGELTYLMSQRYAGVLAQVTAHGGRPGCEAFVRAGAKGLEVVLRLPRAVGSVFPVAQPKAPSPSRRPMWIAAAAVAFVFVLIGALTNNDDSPSSKTTAADLGAATTTTTTTAPRTTTTVPTTTTTTTTTTTVAPALVPPPAARPTTDPVTQAPPPPAPAPSCDPNYDGCVPIASDVDCEGGSGNGPAFVRGPVRVIGTDIYELDGKDNDGIGCE